MSEIAFADLIQRVRDNDEIAIQQLIDEYGEAMKREVRFSLFDSRLRRVVSESDICQSVMMRLISGIWAGSYDLESSQQLQMLLKRMVKNKVVDVARFWQAKRRDLRRDRTAGATDEFAQIEQPETPNKVLADTELLNRIRRRMSIHEIQIMELRQDRVTWDEIAKRLGGDTNSVALRKQYSRTIERIVEQFDEFN